MSKPEGVRLKQLSVVNGRRQLNRSAMRLHPAPDPNHEFPEPALTEFLQAAYRRSLLAGSLLSDDIFQTASGQLDKDVVQRSLSHLKRQYVVTQLIK